MLWQNRYLHSDPGLEVKLSLPLLLLIAAISAETRAEVLSPDSWKDAYSKRNVRLGITLEEFRKVPFPDPDEEYQHTVPSPRCSNDPIAADYVYMGFIGDATGYEAVGAIKCGYYGTYTFMVNPYMDEQRLEQISPLLVDWAPDANYYFFRPHGAESYYLFHITTGGNWQYMEVISALEGALGQPTQRSSVDLENAFGARVRSTTSIWDNGVSKIRVVSNNGAIDHHTLDYELTLLLDVVKAELEKHKKENRSRL